MLCIKAPSQGPHRTIFLRALSVFITPRVVQVTKKWFDSVAEAFSLQYSTRTMTLDKHAVIVRKLLASILKSFLSGLAYY